MKYLILALSFLTFTNTNTCNTNKNEKIAKKEEVKSQDTSRSKFYINSLNGKDVSEEKLHITIDEEHNSISGFSGCNTFSCKYKTEKDSISVGFAMASKMYCPEKTALEDEFFKALSEVKVKRIKEDSLFLENNKGTVLFYGIKTPQ
ncbi:META domain-containing protein [Aquimarina mytili]|uniref:META domain-containing protein n=1 Tax=Aquimarina mytili TaxID=874423 RepID=A0A936ZPN3_9FLAO|nr:META domain-containing protein [Aquimarina mytili]MBL0682413.1 META domain-containing protein [Aquimarina mytili]